jgi:hypothetical protein
VLCNADPEGPHRVAHAAGPPHQLRARHHANVSHKLDYPRSIVLLTHIYICRTGRGSPRHGAADGAHRVVHGAELPHQHRAASCYNFPILIELSRSLQHKQLTLNFTRTGGGALRHAAADGADWVAHAAGPPHQLWPRDYDRACRWRREPRVERGC